ADHVDLLPGSLTDVADPQVSPLAVEREPPGVPHAIGVAHDPARPPADVELEDLRQQAPLALAAVLRIAGAAAVAQADVQLAVGTECDVAPRWGCLRRVAPHG